MEKQSNTGTSGNVINLPSGGGAIGGMGEKFAPDLFTGTGNFSVPIALLPGRNGFQPDITIVYSSGNGNGPFGLGWNLSIPGVSRKTSRGIPLYDEEKDVFLLSGAEDLIEIDRELIAVGEYKITYKPRTEGLFARIERYLGIDNDYWKVWSKDGLISFYGTPASKNTNTKYNDPATCADPDHKANVFEWKLTKTVDVFGNFIEYEYERENINTKAPLIHHNSDQLYLKRIRYSDYKDGDETKFLCSVVFVYQDRPDPFSSYRAGFEMRYEKRCNLVEVYSHPEEVATLSKSYNFIYLDERVALRELKAEVLPLNNGSVLSQVKVTGHHGEAIESLPPIEFGYTNFDKSRREFDPIRGNDLPAFSLGDGRYELIDLDGNGLPDIVELGGALPRYWKNLGNGNFDVPRFMNEAPSGIQLDDPAVQLIDADGDGKADLMVNKSGLNGYYSLGFNGEWNHKKFHKYKTELSFNINDPEVRLIDLDGDGVTDALRNGSRLECFFNDAELGFYKTTTIEKKQLDAFPNISFADPRVRFVDMCGDGLQDIVLLYDGNVEYWPNLGYGNFAPRKRMSNSPRFPYQYNPERILIGDVDGDGMSDIIYVDENKITYWVNQGGESWSDPVTIAGTPSARDMKAIRLVDLYGSGGGGILYSYDYDGTSKERMFYLDFTGGIKPYVLSEMNNHMGAITRVQYRPSTYYYLSDRQGFDPFDVNNPLRIENKIRRVSGKEIKPTGAPKKISRRPWKTYLPMVVQVVAKVEVIDQLSEGKLTTQYAYHHGYWDGGEREFRGFGNVVQRDTETFDRYNHDNLALSPPLGGDVFTLGENRGGFAQGGANGVSSRFRKISSLQFTPPIETRSWFHLGPIGDEVGDWEEVDFKEEYWSEDKNMLERPDEMISLIKSLPRRARRDAYRTLRGSLLRSEVYALDGTARQNRPYTVSENLQGVRLEHEPLLPPGGGTSAFGGGGGGNKQGSGYIFFSFGVSSRTTQWERGQEPMHSFSFTEDYDLYGNPRKQLAFAVPRGKDPRSGAKYIGSTSTQDQNYFITYSETTFAHKDEITKYLIARPVKAAAFEIENDGGGSVFKLKDQIIELTKEENFPYAGDYTPLHFTLLTLNFTYYDGTAFTGLSLGSIGDYGVAVRSETLAFTDGMLDDIYETDRPVYLQADETPGTPSWTGDYPESFRSKLPENGGYIFHDGDSNYIEGFYCIGNRMKFDFHDSPSTAKGLPLETKDPLDNVTTIVYDTYKLLPLTVTDALGMETSAEYDYRIMQVKQVIDPNENRSQVAFSPLGFVIKTAVMGKESESFGDTLENPGTLMEYDFFNFMNNGDPVFVKSTVHEGHYESGSGGGDYSKTIVSVQYSDGFGRMIQTRSQCEEIIFGDPLFGDSGLATPGGSDADAIGVENTDTDRLNVIVSGWQVYNNKGQVVEKFEPYYDKTFDFQKPNERILGESAYIHFNGSGEVLFPQQEQYYFGTNDFTVEGWVNYENSSDWRTIISTSNFDGTSFCGYGVAINGNRFYIGVSDYTGVAEIGTVQTFPPGQWYHVVAQKIGTDGTDFKIYINGVDQSMFVGYSNNLTTGDVNAGPISDPTIGGNFNSNISWDPFIGGIQHVRMYNRLLTEEEIKDNYAAGRSNAPAITDGMVFWAPLTEGNGSSVKDKSVYKNAGIFEGSGTTWENRRKSVNVKMFYDPRGQVIRTLNPDGTEQRVLFGIPVALDNPNMFEATPWESYTYDANDLAELFSAPENGVEDPLNPANVPTDHHYTPSNSEIDGLGRTIKTTDRNYKDAAVEEVVMKYSYDIRGNLLEVLDPYDRTVFEHSYDLLNRNLVTTHIDGGKKVAVFDCLNRPAEARDAKGALVLNAYDDLHRPTHVWCRDNDNEVTRLCQRTLYGDSAGLSDPEDDNLKGKPYKVYDEAGVTTIATYDFKGNPPEKIREVISDEVIMDVFDGPPVDWEVPTYRTNWDPDDDDNTDQTLSEMEDILLDAALYTTSMEYDALNRVTKMTYPEDVDSERKILIPEYNRAGALTKVSMKDSEIGDPTVYVDRIAYNARGQKILMALGNDTMTRYLYRNDNFRLARMKTEKYIKTDSAEYITYAADSGTIKQNFVYDYDLAGNIVSITDTTTDCGYGGSPDELEREFSYDALYRLLSATGRETANTASYPWDDTFRPQDRSLASGYTQNYEYDKLGNIQELQHTGDTNFTRTFSYISGKNHLDEIEIGMDTYTFSHDVNGNILSEGDISRHLEYDYADRLRAFYVQAGTSEPSKFTHYLYDASGNRVKKITRKQSGGYQSVTYIDGIFEYTKEDGFGDVIPYLEVGEWIIGGSSGEQNILYISGAATRRIGDSLDDPTPEIKYNLQDHLGSSTLLLDTDGALVSWEEYYPFGESSFGGYAKKRYRFCGKEKDEESGLYYYGLRYYSAWTCRFISVDPLSAKTPGLSPYCYANCNPVMMNDPTGGSAEGAGGDPGPTTHKVVSGETGGVIAKKNNIKWEDFEKWNSHVKNWGNLQIGTILYLSKPTSSVTSNATSPQALTYSSSGVGNTLWGGYSMGSDIAGRGGRDMIKREFNVASPTPTQTSVSSPSKSFAKGTITDADYQRVAKELGVEPEALMAIAKKESGPQGSFYGKGPGQATILFERHKMYTYVGKEGMNQDSLYLAHPNLVNPIAGGYGKYGAQYTKLAQAKEINSNAAIMSSSWGRFQVMGETYSWGGYSSPQELETAMNTSEMEQFNYFVSFLKAKGNGVIIQALKDHNWETVAYYYNGPKWREKNPQYASLLEKYYNEFKNAKK